MDRIKLNLISPLWCENARDLEAHRIAKANKLQRRLFPWLALLAILSVLFLVWWAQS